MRLAKLTSVLFSLVWLISFAFSQSPNGRISGSIMDATGGMIASADVLVINDLTGVKSATRSNSEGIYVLPNLPPGPYRLQVSKNGFKTLIKPDIILNVQDAVSINFTLPVGARLETVTVEGGAPLVNTQNASVGTVIDHRLAGSLPLNGRSFNTLLQLTPGVVIAPSGATANGSPGQFSIAGQRTDANNFTVDGVSANFGITPTFGSIGSGTGAAQAFSALGGTSSLVSVEALQEFRIETSSFAPEFGRAPGGQVLLTTRSGTNLFHGGIFDYFRNTAMDANNWFNDAHNPPLPKAPEHHNDFGGFLGGAIVKDKTFFFLSYEGARLDEPQSQTFEVPSLYARAQAPASLVPFLNAYPKPNGQPASPVAFIAPFTGSFSNTAMLDAGSVRVDHALSSRYKLFGRFSDAPSQLVNLNVTLPSNPQTIAVNTKTLTVGLDALWNAQLSNALRGNFSTQNSSAGFSQDSFAGAVPLSGSALQGISLAGNSSATFLTFDTFKQYTIGNTTTNRTKQLNLVDDLSWTVRTHQLKFGADYRDIFLYLTPYASEFNFSVPTISGFISSGRASLFAESVRPSQFLSQALSLYGQDTWKLTPKLTVTYGLRWELSPAPSARSNTTLAAWNNVQNPALLAPATGRPLWNTTYTNFAPRLGIAFSPSSKQDLVFRIGGGIFYDLGVGPTAQLGVTYPNSASASLSGVALPAPNPASYLPAITTAPPFPTGTEGYSPDLKLPRSYQWNAAVERSFGPDQALSITYAGQNGDNLLREEASYQPNANFAGVFLLWQNSAYSNYHSLQLQYRRPVANRLQALVNYTWSHSLDNSSNDAVAGISGTVISAATDYASSDFDVRNSFSGALTYLVPSVTSGKALSSLAKDWSIEAVTVARSGFPFNAFLLSGSPVPGGFVRSRPDLLSGAPVWIANPVAPGGKSLNPAAFVVPSTVRQGTEGRNDITGFGLTQVDLSIARTFPISDRLNLQFRGDAFNVLNHPNFSNPPALIGLGPAYLSSGTMLNQSLGGLSPLFQEGGPRSLQVSLKLTF